MKVKDVATLLLISIITYSTANSQEIIKEIYEIHPISWKNPLMSFEKNETLKVKYKEVNNRNDTITIHEIVNKIQADMHFRAKCFEVANNLESDDAGVIDLKGKMNLLLKKWNFYLNLDYKIDKKYQEEIREKNNLNDDVKKDFKDYRGELLKEINAIARDIDNNFPCPGGFKTIRGNVKFENGYLSFVPLKYRILDTLKYNKWDEKDKKVQRIKSYLNGEDDNKERRLGIKLKPNELVRLKNKSSIFGALTMPFKIYASSKEKDSTKGNNVFTDANISIFIGHQWGYHGYNSKGEIQRKKMHSINYLFGASKVALKKNNSSRTESSDFNLLALSTGIAYGFNLNKFSLFIGTGIDIPLHSEGRKWYFDKQIWLGFGLGFSVFK